MTAEGASDILRELSPRWSNAGHGHMIPHAPPTRAASDDRLWRRSPNPSETSRRCLGDALRIRGGPCSAVSARTLCKRFPDRCARTSPRDGGRRDGGFGAASPSSVARRRICSRDSTKRCRAPSSRGSPRARRRTRRVQPRTHARREAGFAATGGGARGAHVAAAPSRWTRWDGRRTPTLRRRCPPPPPPLPRADGAREDLQPSMVREARREAARARRARPRARRGCARRECTAANRRLLATRAC